MNKTYVLLIAALFTLGSRSAHLSVAQRVSHEQSSFNMEDAVVDHPAQIPKSALRVLVEDRHVAQQLRIHNLSPDQIPSSWFQTAEVHLDGGNEKDFVVIGKGDLLGANVTPFWVIRNSDKGTQLVLAVPAHELRILKSRSRGFKDIWVGAVISGDLSTITYHFDGEKYQVFQRGSAAN